MDRPKRGKGTEARPKAVNTGDNSPFNQWLDRSIREQFAKVLEEPVPQGLLDMIEADRAAREPPSQGKRLKSPCPDAARKCAAATPGQRWLTERERRSLTGRAAGFVDGAKVCVSCHLVYVAYSPAVVRLGWLESVPAGINFRPAPDMADWRG